MKHISILSGILIVAIAFVIFGFTQEKSDKMARTEEYAIVDVWQSGKEIYIRVTQNEQSAQETFWEKSKTTKVGDFTPVIKALNNLNTQGYEIVNGSLVHKPSVIGNMEVGQEIVYSYLLRKKI